MCARDDTARPCDHTAARCESVSVCVYFGKDERAGKEVSFLRRKTNITQAPGQGI